MKNEEKYDGKFAYFMKYLYFCCIFRLCSDTMA